MKKIILALAVVGFTAASAFAGNGSCGDKKEGCKDGSKEKAVLKSVAL